MRPAEGLGAVIILWIVIHHSGCRPEDTTASSSLDMETNEGILRADLGVYFKKVGTITASTDKLYITVAIKVPEIPILPLPAVPQHCVKQSVKYGRVKRRMVDICGKYRHLIHDSVVDKLYDKYRYTLIDFKWSAENLKDDIASNINETLATLKGKYGTSILVRKKRAFPLLIPIVMGVVQGAMAIGGAVAAHVRHNKLQKSMRSILERDNFLRKHHLDFVERTITFNDLLIKKVSNLENQINNTHEGLQDIANQFNRELAKVVEHQTESTGEIVQFLLMLTQLSTSHNSYLRNYLSHIQRFKSYTDKFLRGAMKLSEGKLPQELINVETLTGIFRDCEASLNERPGDYELFSVDPMAYYSRKDVIYGRVDNTLFIQFIAPLRRKNQSKMVVYKVETTFVPFDALAKVNTKGEYTRVTNNHRYFGIEGNNYCLITKEQFEYCDIRGTEYLCDTKLVYVHENRKSCLSTIFYRLDIADIVENCDFKYYRALNPPPQIIDAGNVVLLSAFGTPWLLDCDHRQIPFRHDGQQFAIIDKQSMCGCSLTAPSLYLDAHSSQCINSEIGNFRPKFVVNSAIIGTFYANSNNDSLIDLDRLYDELIVPSIKMPDLHIREFEASHVLLGESDVLTIKLKDLHKATKDNHELYLSADAKLADDSTIKKWFEHGNVDMMVLTTLSVAGGICTMLIMCMLARHCKLDALVGAMAFNPTKVEAQNLLQGQTHIQYAKGQISIENLMQALTIHVCFMIAFYLGFKLMKRVLRKLSVTRFFIPQKRKLNLRSALTDIYLGLSDGLDEIDLYCGSLKIYASQLKNMPSTDFKIENHFKRCVYDTIKMNWGNLLLYVGTFREELTLPTEIMIPILDKRKFRRIMRGNYTLRVLFVTDSLIYHTVGQALESRILNWFKKPRVTLKPPRKHDSRPPKQSINRKRSYRREDPIDYKLIMDPLPEVSLGIETMELGSARVNPKHRVKEYTGQNLQDDGGETECLNINPPVKMQRKFLFKRHSSETDLTEKSWSDSDLDEVFKNNNY